MDTWIEVLQIFARYGATGLSVNDGGIISYLIYPIPLESADYRRLSELGWFRDTPLMWAYLSRG